MSRLHFGSLTDRACDDGLKPLSSISGSQTGTVAEQVAQNPDLRAVVDLFVELVEDESSL